MLQDEITHLKLSPIAFGSCLSEKNFKPYYFFQKFSSLAFVN